jgi:hypothetical protein
VCDPPLTPPPLLQFRLLTTLASERLFLVWQRFSISLISAAIKLLELAMGHERDINYVCNDRPEPDDNDDGEADDDAHVGGWGRRARARGKGRDDDNFPPTDDDDCGGAGIQDKLYSLTPAFWVTFACGCIFMVVVQAMSWIGPEQFQRTKRWLHGHSGARLVMFGEEDMNVLWAGILLVSCTVLLVFVTEGVYLIRDPDI